MPVSTQLIRQSLASTGALARAWFRSVLRSKTDFDARGGLQDPGTGAVYAYFTAAGAAVYVGQTGRNVKARLHDKTSPHKKKHWWHSWSHMRFVTLPDDTDRLVLEALLIATYEPTANEKPRAKCISTLFPV
jgi:hypothetical protein